MARAWLAEGNASEALAAAERAVACEPGNDWGHRLVALSFQALGQPYEALEAAREAVRLSPHSREAQLVLGQCQLDADLVEDALETAKQLVGLAPNWSASYRLLCVISLKMNDSKAAAKNARQALACDPASAIDWNNLGVAYLRSYRLIRAARCYVHALQVEPGNATAQRNLKRLVMPMSDPGIGGRYLLAAPLVLPRVVIFALFLRPTLPSSIRKNFLARPITSLEVVSVVIAAAIGGLLTAGTLNTGSSLTWYGIIAVAAAALYLLIRLFDTVMWHRAGARARR